MAIPLLRDVSLTLNMPFPPLLFLCQQAPVAQFLPAPSWPTVPVLPIVNSAQNINYGNLTGHLCGLIDRF